MRAPLLLLYFVPPSPQEHPSLLAGSRAARAAPSWSSAGGGRPCSAVPGQIPQAQEHPHNSAKLEPSPIGPWRRRSTGLRGAPGGNAMAAAASPRSGETTPGIGQPNSPPPSAHLTLAPGPPKPSPTPRESLLLRRPHLTGRW